MTLGVSVDFPGYFCARTLICMGCIFLFFSPVEISEQIVYQASCCSLMFGCQNILLLLLLS